MRKYNEKLLHSLPGEYQILQAINILSTKKHFDPLPDETDGKVKGTPFIKDLYLKKGARFTLNYNVDVVDGLNNGAKGVVLDLSLIHI